MGNKITSKKLTEDTEDQNEFLQRITDNASINQQLINVTVNQIEATMGNNITNEQVTEDDQNESLPRIMDNNGTSQQFTDKTVLLRIKDNDGTSQQFTEDTVNQNESLPRIMDNNGTSQQFTEDTVNQNESLPRIMDNDGTSKQVTEDTVNQNESSNVSVSETLNKQQNTEEKVDKNKGLPGYLCLEENSTSKDLKNELQADNIVDQNEGLLGEPGSEKSESLNSVLRTDIKGKSEAFDIIPSLENKVIKEETDNFLCDIRIENNLTTKVMTCQPCMEVGDQIIAEGFCKDCKNYLCALCLKMHLRPKPMRSHRLIKKEMPERKLDEVILSERMIEEETCPKHEEKIIEYYCEDDKVLGCSVCMALKHRTCNITYLPNNFTELFDMANSKQLDEDIFTLKDELEKGKIEIQSFKNQVEVIAEKAISDVTAYRNKLVLKIDNIQKAMINEVKQMKKKDDKCLDKIFHDISDLELTLKQKEEDLKRKEQTGWPGTQMYLCIRDNTDEVKEYQGVFENIMEKKPGITSYQFQPTNAFLKAKTKQFGCFKIRNNKSEVKGDRPVAKIASTKKKLEPVRVSDVAQAKASDKIKDVKLTASSSKAKRDKHTIVTAVQSSDKIKDVKLAAVSSTAKRDKHTSITAVQSSASAYGHFINEIDVKSATDKQTCVITGMTMVDNQKIALCDFANCCVKIINITNNYKLTFISQMSSPPYEAAFTGKHLVVTQPWKGTLAIITNTNQFKPTISLSIGAECRGIAYRDEKFFVSFKTNPAVIKVLRETGEVLRTFRSVGGDTFNHPCHLALHPTRETLYVSDWQVAILGFDGSLVRKHRDLGFIDLKGVSVSIDGNLYVCDKGRNVVYVLLPMVSTKQVFLDESHSIKKPYALLATGCTKKKLYVSMDESNFIKVFQIS